ncbi:Regulatory protein BlaR1 [Paenibacillus konkukensis]|uniref:Regulatory protein BlaR1 n=1 Tax=Paenibacillus konkukensis TaxID=2020716 RepID=A0ABY4RQ84_9BACL|nr:M56 family metallopeptidase [Paenibacillus konkukensis]UQZ84627.1 Regulatory protein BlaR1 [Paenibacillus konkukensis]
MKWIETAFDLMWTASLASTIIILLLLLMRRRLYKRLGPRIVHVLWLLVLIKLLVPIAPQSPVSFFNLVPQNMQDFSFWPKSFQEEHPASSATEMAAAHSETADSSPAPEPQLTEEPASIAKPSSFSSDYPFEQARDKQPTWFATGSLVWLAGMLSLMMYYLAAALRFHRKTGASRKLDNVEALAVLEACKEKLGITAAIPVYETDCLHSPYIYGLFKPRIYIPADIVTIADSRQLTHILLHELTHYKRKDLWFHFLWTWAALLHWYNPVVWLSAKKARADREVACDAGVLEVLGEQESSSYGRTLLMLSRLFTRSASHRVTLSHFSENNKEMKRRITMIAKFKKGTYKLSAAAVILIVALSAVMLTNASESASSLKIQRVNDWSKWFHNLGRANEFAGFPFKVPDDLPDGYQLASIDVDEKYVNRTDNQVTINFVSNHGTDDEKQFEVIASTGNIIHTALSQRLEGGETRKIPGPSWGEAQPQTYIQDEVTYANKRGILVTTVQKYELHQPEIEKTFFWRDDAVYYAIRYYSEDHTLEEGLPRNRRNLTQDELERILQSFRYPQQLQHVSYDGKGNSFPIYDQKDLAEAERLLGFTAKFPLALSNNGLKLADSVMLQAGDQNTDYAFRHTVNALRNFYWAADDSGKGSLTVYQSQSPLIDGSQLALNRALDMNGIRLSVYKDEHHVYGGPYYRDADHAEIITETYYLWKQNGIYYAANVDDRDIKEEAYDDLVQSFLLASE